MAPVQPTPQADSYPLAGSAIHIARQGFADFLVAQHRKHGSVFKLNLMGQKYKVMAGAKANVFAIRQGDQYLTGKGVWDVFAKEIKADYFIATLDGAEHTVARKVIKEPYSRRNLERQWDSLWQITDDFLAENAGIECGTYALMQKLVATQLGILLLDRPPGEYLEDFSIYLHTILGVMLGIRPKISFKMPKYVKAKQRVTELAQLIIQEHKDTTRNPPDLADSLLKASQEHPIMFAEESLTFSILGPYVGGLDTVAGTLAFVLYAIHKYNLAGIIREELCQVDEIKPATMRQLPRLHATILEAMRYYSVAPIVPRTVAQPFEFEGHSFDQGEKVMVATSTGHRDHLAYTDPDKFDIERCLPPRNEHKHPGAFSPYGVGSHTCAAAGFADLQITTTIALLFKKYDVQVTNDHLKYVTNAAVAPSNKHFRIVVQEK